MCPPRICARPGGEGGEREILLARPVPIGDQLHPSVSSLDANNPWQWSKTTGQGIDDVATQGRRIMPCLGRRRACHGERGRGHHRGCGCWTPSTAPKVSSPVRSALCHQGHNRILKITDDHWLRRGTNTHKSSSRLYFKHSYRLQLQKGVEAFAVPVLNFPDGAVSSAQAR